MSAFNWNVVLLLSADNCRCKLALVVGSSPTLPGKNATPNDCKGKVFNSLGIGWVMSDVGDY